MKTRSAWVLAGLFIGPLVGCASTKEAAPVETRLVRDTEIQSAEFQSYWQAQLPLRGGDVVDRLFLRDDNLYVATDMGEIYAVKSDVGLLRWTHALTKPGFTIFPPQHLQTSSGSGHVVIATTEELWLFDRHSGERIRRSPIPFPPAVGVIGDSNSLYSGGSDGILYCHQWLNNFGLDPVEIWRLKCSSRVTTTPVLRDGILYVGTQKGHLASCTASDKGYGWVVKLDDSVVGDLAVDDARVYAASSDRSLYAVHRGTGRIVWRSRFPKPLEEGPVLKGDTLFQRCADLGISAVEVRDGGVRWTHPDAVAFLSEAQGEAALLRRGGWVDVVDVTSGKVVRSIDCGPVHAAAPNTEDDAIYLGYSDGRLVCLRMKESPYLRKQEVEAAQALLNRQGPASGGGVSIGAPTMRREAPDPLRSDRDRPN